MYSEILTDLIIAKILSVTTIYNEGGTKLKRMNRTRWAIIQKYEGETEYYSNGNIYISNRHRMVILPKGIDYDWNCTKAGHYCVIEFDSDKTCNEIMTFDISEQTAERILRTMKELEYKRTARSPLFELECLKETYGILLRLAEVSHRAYIPSEKRSKIQGALDCIAKDYTRSYTNDELASICGISTVYFRKLFTELCGTSPINYIHSVRIEKAKEMLRNDGGNVTDIALSLGYPNIYDFSRTFKKHTGVSPTGYVESEQHSL